MQSKGSSTLPRRQSTSNKHEMCYSLPMQKALLCSVCAGSMREALQMQLGSFLSVFVLQALITG